MFNSLFFAIAYLALLTGCLAVKKNDRRESFITWTVLVIMFTLCYQTAVASVFWKTEIPVSVLTVGIADLAAGILFWIMALKGGKQSYKVDRYEILGMLVCFLTASYYFVKRYDMGNTIDFVSVDSASFFNIAHIIAREHRIPTNMFMAHLSTALPMEMGRPLIGDFNSYKVVLLWEIGYFFLSGMMFFVLIRSILEKKGMKAAGLVTTFFYMLAYPLYSMIFGFSYFGLSITLIGYLIYVTGLFISESVRRRVSYVMINFGLFGLFMCYMMFVPPIYVGILLAIFAGAYFVKGRKIIALKTIKECFGVFLIPSVCGLLLTFANLIFISSDVVNSGASNADGGSRGIATDGGCYNELYTNFVCIFPFVLIGIAVVILAAKAKRKAVKEAIEEAAKKKEIVTNYEEDLRQSMDITTLALTIAMAVFMAALLILCFKKYVSVYYYVKNNNIMWLLTHVLLIKGMAHIYDKSRLTVGAIYVSFLLAMGMLFFNVDARIQAGNERFMPNAITGFFNIYSFNHEFNSIPGQINAGDVNVYRYVRENISAEDEPSILVLGGYIYTAWFPYMTDQKNVRQVSEVPQYQETDLSDYKYVVVQYSEIYSSDKEFFDSLGNVIYQGTDGFVVEME